MAGRRQERVAQILKEEISTIIVQELRDPRLGFVTVTDVTLSPDLRTARVKVSVLGEPGDERKTMHALRSAAGFIQQGVADRVTLKFTPVLRFEVDESVKKSVRLSRLIRDALEESGGQEEESRGSNTD